MNVQEHFCDATMISFRTLWSFVHGYDLSGALKLTRTLARATYAKERLSRCLGVYLVVWNQRVETASTETTLLIKCLIEGAFSYTVHLNI